MLRFKLVLAALVCLMAVACNPQSKEKKLFDKGVSLGVNKNGKLEEASGLVESVRQPGYFWTHNDSGNPPEIFLIDRQAKTKKVFTLKGIKNRDWEDLAIGTGPEQGKNYLYIGDIGDNVGRFDVKYIYRVAEPAIDDASEISDVTTFIVKLEDGERDTETMMFDPVSKNLYLVSKREKKVMLYEIKYPFSGDTLVAKNVGSLPIRYANGGSISPEGNEVLIRTYDEIFYWKKTGNESIVDLLKTPPVNLPYNHEPQGEAIAWALDGTGYYTISENAKGIRGKLYFYKRN